MNNSESRLTCSMSNGVMALMLIAALLVPIRAIAESEQHAVARKYAALVGRLALTESLFSEMSLRCDVDFAYTTQQYSAIDYHLRIHTGMTFNQWQAQFGDAEQSNAMVEQVMNDTLRDIGECNPEGLQQWFAGMQQNLVGHSVDELTSLPLVFGLRARSVSEQEAVAFFRSQVLAYKTLSVAEVVGLAHGLSTGGYHYAKMVYLPNIQIDHQKAVTLYEFAYQQEASAENLFALAQGKARVDRDASVPLFKQAAEEGLFEAQRWYGNYLGCQGNKPDALFWLQQAKETNPEQAEFIDDFIIEINELGEPTNCLDGWVH